MNTSVQQILTCLYEDKSGKFEWTARVLNINKEYNLPLQKKCKPLYDYIQFVSRINENKDKGMTIEDAVDEAIDWACKQNLLEGYIREQKAIEDATNMLRKKFLASDISEITGLPLEQVLELQKQITVQA